MNQHLEIQVRQPHPDPIKVRGLALGLCAAFWAIAAVGQQTLAPTFSVARGFYSNFIQVALTTPTPGAQIRYTTNGLTPATNVGRLYSGSITIRATTPLRAMAYATGLTNSEVVTHTYLFLTNVLRQPNNPLGYPALFAKTDTNGPYPADYEMDLQVVNHTNNAGKWMNILTAVPTLSIVTSISNLFDPTNGIYYNPNRKGDEWERPVNLEWIAPAGGTGFTAHAGLRIHGDASRRPWRQPKKSLRALFKSVYGTDKLKFPLFQSHGEVFAPLESFDRLIFRNGGNRTWSYWDRDQRREADYVNDEWARRAQLQMGHLTAHGTYAHLYLNGLYWGLYNIAERLDEKFYASYLGGDPDLDYDVIAPDEDLGDLPVAEVGTIDAYNALIAAVAGTNAIADAQLVDLARRVDFVSLADYILLEHFVGNSDWPNHNWNTYRNRTGPDTRFKFSVWDADSGLNKTNDNTTLLDDADSPVHVYFRLLTHPDFRQLVGDRIQKHLFSGGALTPEVGAARYAELTAIIDQAVVGESARWGDYSRDVYQWTNAPLPKYGPAYLYSRDLSLLDADPGDVVTNSQQKNWLQVRSEKLAGYFPNRRPVFLAQYKTNGWYSDAVLAPVLSQYGGNVPEGFTLVVSNPNAGAAGDILYSLNGIDPRAPGGSVDSRALNGGDGFGIRITNVIQFKARVRNGAGWSNLQDYNFRPPLPFVALVINEINYKDGTNFVAGDWAEIFNPTAAPVEVSGWKVQDDDPTHNFVIPVTTRVPARGFLVVAADLIAFRARHPAITNVVGNMGFGLGASDSLVLLDGSGRLVDRVDYSSLAPWPAAPNGTGPTLALTNPAIDNSLAGSWVASAQTGGTPGAANFINQSPTDLSAFAANGYLTLSFRVPAGMQVSGNAVEKSPQLVNWTSAEGFFPETARTQNPDGSETVKLRVPMNQLPSGAMFFRLALSYQ